jgi:hypothetical protein
MGAVKSPGEAVSLFVSFVRVRTTNGMKNGIAQGLGTGYQKVLYWAHVAKPLVDATTSSLPGLIRGADRAACQVIGGGRGVERRRAIGNR